MKVVEFHEGLAGRLLEALDHARLPARLLRLPAYREHYFGRRPDCRLLLLTRGDGSVAATLGSERVQLRIGEHDVQAAVLSNTYSIDPGAIGFLLQHWMKSVDVGLCLPGNALLTGLLSRQPRWQRVHGLHTFWLNWHFPDQPGDAPWKRALRPLVRRLRRRDGSTLARRARPRLPSGLAVQEETAIDASMLPADSRFALRLCADAPQLNWRFARGLGYVSYRLFSITRDGRRCGYLVFGEWPDRLILSQADAESPDDLAGALLLAIAALNRDAQRFRQVLVSSMDEGMRSALRRAGFEPGPAEMPLFIGRFRGDPVDIRDSGRWLVNLDLGDAGLVFGRFDR